MVDMAASIIPNSQQLNADDLIAGPRTVTITRVTGSDSPEQPVNVHFDGDNGKPYKPCKSMRRVMVHAWGPDAAQYVGRSMTLFCDPAVQFGGLKVGGIRISHMTHIDRDLVLALTVTKAKRSPYTVKRLAEVAPARDAAADWAAGFMAAVDAAETDEALQTAITKNAKRLSELANRRPELHQQCQSTISAALAKHQAPSAAPTTDSGDDF